MTRDLVAWTIRPGQSPSSSVHTSEGMCSAYTWLGVRPKDGHSWAAPLVSQRRTSDIINGTGLTLGETEWATFLRRSFSHELIGVEEEAVSGLSCDVLRWIVLFTLLG